MTRLARSRPTRPVAATLDFRSHDGFRRRVEPLRPSGEPATLRLQLRLLRRILIAAAQGRPLILYSSRGTLKPDLLACLVMSYWPPQRRPPVVLVGEMWQPTAGVRSVLERALVRRVDRVVDRYLVLSRAEAELLPRNWPVDGRKTRVCPFYFAAEEHGVGAGVPTRGTQVVAGGDSFRDYGPLIEAAERMPEVPFLLVTKTLDPAGPLPANVTVRPAAYSEYLFHLSEAAVVVAPVQVGLRRSAGILTFLMAMYLSKPTITTDALAVREYVDDGVTGLIVDGSTGSYVSALRRLLGDETLAERLGAAGRRVVEERYTFDRYVQTILDELDSAAAERAG